MPSSAKLLFRLDPLALQSDLAQIPPDLWVAHFNKDYYEGQWTGVALRSGGGLPDRLYPDPNIGSSVEDTPVLEWCPNIRHALAKLQCRLRFVRFLKLSPGSIIQEHRDYDLGFELGQSRLHIPIFTNTEVDFFLDAERIEMQAGECWYLDLSLPHWVRNRGQTDRIHLVVDCELNDWLRDLILANESPDSVSTIPQGGDISSPDEFERFREIVLTDLVLQRRLRQTADRESFIRFAVSTGRLYGCFFGAIDVESAMESARQAWCKIWIE